MKPTYKSFFILLLVVCFTTGSYAHVTPTNDRISIGEAVENAFEKREFSKTINKQFPITSNGKVNLSNRYGQVTIKTWSNNEVKIEVVIKVNSRSEDDAQDVFDRISIDFNSSKDYVSAVTEIASKSGWSSLWSGGSSDDYAINYEVYMPETNNLDLFNKYGNSTVPSLRGTADLEIKYGNIHVDEIDGDVNLNLGYGNASITSAKTVGLTVKYSKVKIGSANDVTIESKYSNITIDEAADIRSESKYDHYHLGNINDYHNVGKYDDIHIKTAKSLRAAAKYSDYTVDHLSDWADLDLEYGSAKIEELSKAFTAIEIRGRYTEYRITVQEGTHYQLDAVTRYAGIRYPSVFNVERDIENGPEKEIKGYVGDKNGGKVIKARLNYGGIKVNQ